jgi:hypothetical protein
MRDVSLRFAVDWLQIGLPLPNDLNSLFGREAEFYNDDGARGNDEGRNLQFRAIDHHGPL